jgi:hypothetical protein
MRIDEPNQNCFDSMLKDGLQKHFMHVPPEFAQKLLTRIQRQEYAAALAVIKMKERLLLAAMILMLILLAAIVLLVPSQVAAHINTLIANARQTLEAFAAADIWPFRYWIAVAVAAGMLLYGLFEGLSAEN